MEIFMQVIGGLIIVLILLIVLTVAFYSASDNLAKWLDRLNGDSRVLGRKELGIEIMQQAYWLNEHYEAKELLILLGKEIANNRGSNFDMMDIRDTWLENSPTQASESQPEE